MKTIDEIFEGVWVSDGEFLIQCPYCNDHPTHNHCYVNIKKSVFNCFYCGESGTLKKLLKDFGDDEKVKTIRRRHGVKERQKHKEISIDEFNRFNPVTGANGTNDLLALKYLENRGLRPFEIRNYDIRYASSGKYFGRVIIPIYEEGDLVCFIARSFLDMIEPKYLFPKHGETKLTTNEALFGYEKSRDYWSSNHVIVEGVFDAIKINQTDNFKGIAIMSKHLSEGQKYKLLKLEGTFYIMLDSDAKLDSLKVAGELSKYGKIVKVAFIKSKDPGEASLKEIRKALRQAEPFSYELEMRIKMEDW